MLQPNGRSVLDSREVEPKYTLSIEGFPTILDCSGQAGDVSGAKFCKKYRTEGKS